MKQVIIKEGGPLDAALRQGGPVELVRAGESVGVVLSVETYARQQRALAKQQLLQTMNEAQAYAREQGLTEEILEDLLPDER